MKNNWPTKKIGEIVETTDYVANGSFATLRENVVYRDSEDYALLLRTTDLLNNFTGKLKYIDKHAYDFLSKTRVEGGEIILSNVGTIGAIFRAPKLNRPLSLAPNSIMIKKNSINDFLYYYFLSESGQSQIIDITSQTSQPKFNKTDFRNLNIPIPSEKDQRKIVERLDAIRKAQELCDTQIQKTEELFESIFHNIFMDSGKKWSEKDLEEISTQIGDGLHGTPNYSAEGDYYFINGNNIGNQGINFKENTKRVSIAEFLKYKKNLNGRTILVSINGTLGNVAFYNNEKVVLGKSVCYINIISGVDKSFVKYFLSSDNFKKYAFSQATGATIKNVSLKSIREFKIPLPPSKEQQKIVEKLDAVHNYKKRLLKQKDLLKELFDSVLCKSMRGEMV